MQDAKNASASNRSTDKKTEVLEVRLAFDTKEAFMRACRTKGTTASMVLRQAIDSYIHNKNSHGKAYALTTAIILFLLFIFVYSAEDSLQTSSSHEYNTVDVWQNVPNTNPMSKIYFLKVDANRDSKITLAEYETFIRSQPVTSHNNLRESETALRTQGVALIVQTSHVEDLKTNRRLEKCFQVLEEIGDAERAREFYTLDTNNDNQLTPKELSISWRIPSLYQTQHAFISRDHNVDGELSYEEVTENLNEWLTKTATPINPYTNSKAIDVPPACLIEQETPKDMRLLLRFEKLKRYMDITAKTGVTDDLFMLLDIDRSKGISFPEFLNWYLLDANDLSQV